MTSGSLISHAEPKLLHFTNARSCEFGLLSRKELCAVDSNNAHCKSFIQAALYDVNGLLVPLSERRRGPGGDVVLSVNMPILPEIRDISRTIPGRSVYLGNFMAQYGHFIIETLSKCWSLTGNRPYDNYVFYPFVFRGGTTLSAYHEFFFDKVNISTNKIIILNRSTTFEEIDVPEQLWIVNGKANFLLSSFYSKIALTEGKPLGARKLFLSREQAGYRRLDNVGEVEEVFRRAEFEIIYPESLGIREQMDTYRDAAVIAGFCGSAMHNCIFAPRGCTLIEVGDLRAPNRFMSTQEAANQLAQVRAYRISYIELAPRCISAEHVAIELSKFDP